MQFLASDFWQYMSTGLWQRAKRAGLYSDLLPGLIRENDFSAITVIVQELCKSRGGRPGLSVLTSLLVSVDVKNY